MGTATMLAKNNVRRFDLVMLFWPFFPARASVASVDGSQILLSPFQPEMMSEFLLFSIYITPLPTQR